jgi:50S ribosomal subunit-associated GTPase HflX
MSPVQISAAKGTGLRELRSAIDALAAEAVPDTRANRPIIAADSLDETAADGGEGFDGSRLAVS